MNVSEGVANFFKDQLFGTSDGHMATIPNNPTLRALMIAHGISEQSSKEDADHKIAEFLRECADWIDGGGRA